MKAHELAVYTTIYPGIERFLSSWADSVRQQSDKEFDLWIALDGSTPTETKAVFGNSLPSITWIPSEEGETPAGLRQRTLLQMADRYQTIVLVDSDDVLGPNRVKAARAASEQWDVTSCALQVIDENGHELGITFGVEQECEFDSLLLRHNIFGFSNTTYRADVLRRCLPVPKDCRLMDWLVVMRARLAGASLGFDHTPHMFYRQYSQNIAPIIPPFTPETIVRSTNLVRAHYRFLLEDSESTATSPLRWKIEAARTSVEQFHQKICQGPPEQLKEYAEAVSALPPRFIWWWCVANPMLEFLWTA